MDHLYDASEYTQIHRGEPFREYCLKDCVKLQVQCTSKIKGKRKKIMVFLDMYLVCGTEREL